MSQGNTLAVDGHGIEFPQPDKRPGVKTEAGDKLYGVIVSLYGHGSELLLQKYSAVKLIKECRQQVY